MQVKIDNLNIAYRLSNNRGKSLGDKSLSMVRTAEKGHGRIEIRRYYYSRDISLMIDAKKE